MIETNVIQKRNKYHAQVSRLQEAFCCSASTIKMIKRCFLRRIRVQVRNVLFAGHVSPCPARTLGASLTREGCPGSRPTHGGSSNPRNPRHFEAIEGGRQRVTHFLYQMQCFSHLIQSFRERVRV